MPLSYPTLRDLIRVIPVAQTQTRGDTSISFLSVDCYADGWVCNLRVHRTDPRYYPVFQFHPTYNPDPVRQFGGSGGFFSWHHREGDPNWYLSLIMHPALDPDEPDIEFVIPTVHYSERTPIAWGILMAETQGPWRFRVNPSGGKVAEEASATEEEGRASRTPEQEQRRQAMRAEYSIAYDALLDVLYRYDPIGIAWFSPQREGEYSSEARTIMPRLSTVQSAAEVEQILIEEFQRWFGKVPRTERFGEMAEELWLVLHPNEGSVT